MALDQGGACINRNSTNTSGYTVLDKNNPANETANITQLEIWSTGSNITGLETGSFEDLGSNSITCRGNCSGANISILAGSCVTKTSGGGDFTAYEAAVGEYMGHYFTGGAIEKSSDTGLGMWYKSGDYISTDNNQTYTSQNTRAFSLYGTGAAAGGISINISDTISIAESIGPAYDRWNISASDTVAIAEAITAALTLLDQEVSVADTISIVETLTVLFDRLNINVSDTISVSELITIIKDVLPNVSDAINISEAINLLLAADGVINVSDTVNVVEAITVLFTVLIPSVSDTVSISETLAVLFDVLLPSISDSVSITESVSIIVSTLVVVRRRQGLLLHVY